LYTRTSERSEPGNAPYAKTLEAKTKSPRMTTTIKIITFLFILSSCSSSKYVLKDKGEENMYLISKIKEYQKNGYLSRRPTILVDKEIYKYTDLKSNSLKIWKNDISSIWVIPTMDEGISNQIQIITKKYQKSQDKEKL
jgi:hypothetical protein